MNMYEFTFLLEDSKALKPLEEVLTSFKGKKINEQPWGKRLFAYPIAKHTSAEYTPGTFRSHQTNSMNSRKN